MSQPRMSHPTSRIPARQRGNTLTGVIIGLIVGLIIAVVVALAITKGATPFTDKSVKPSKMGDPRADQGADPNKPLYGNKEAARQANKEVTGKPKEDDPLGEAVAAMTATAAEAKAEAKAAELKAEAKAAEARLAETRLAEAKAAEANPAGAANIAPKPVPAAEAGEEKIIYYLQAGAFREIGDAENTRAKLALLGFEAAISEKPNESGVLHRVRVGPFPQLEAMNKARAKLIDSGIDVAIVKNQK